MKVSSLILLISCSPRENYTENDYNIYNNNIYNIPVAESILITNSDAANIAMHIIKALDGKSLLNIYSSLSDIFF